MTLLDMTEQELKDHFGKYVLASILVFAFISSIADLTSFTVRLYILIAAFIIAIAIWTLNILIYRAVKRQKLYIS